jgi:hypothetical protein
MRQAGAERLIKTPELFVERVSVVPVISAMIGINGRESFLYRSSDPNE